MPPKHSSGLQPSGCLPSPLNELLSFLAVIIWPSQAALSGLVSLYLATSVERDNPTKLLLRRATLGPLYAVIFLLVLPAALCAIPFRCLLCLLRKPFQYSVVQQARSEEEESLTNSLSGCQLKERQFRLASSNTCLLPEFLARINNISHSELRARSIGERIVVDQFFYGGSSDSAVVGLPVNGMVKSPAKKSEGGGAGFAGELATHFPRLDFLCIQEVFDWNYNKLLRRELHKVRMGLESERASVCVCVYVCERERERVYVCASMCACMHVCLCVCVCVCERERERVCVCV